MQQHVSIKSRVPHKDCSSRLKPVHACFARAACWSVRIQVVAKVALFVCLFVCLPTRSLSCAQHGSYGCALAFCCSDAGVHLAMCTPVEPSVGATCTRAYGCDDVTVWCSRVHVSVVPVCRSDLHTSGSRAGRGHDAHRSITARCTPVHQRCRGCKHASTRRRAYDCTIL